MQYTSILLAALAATNTIAAPFRPATLDNTLTVILSNQATETGSQTTFTEGQREEGGPTGSSGPFQTVELRLGKDVQRKDLRCKILDDQGDDIVVIRGENTDITFADGGAGEWTFRKESKVSEIICDPIFVKTDPSNFQTRVILQNQRTELGSQTTLKEGARVEAVPVGSSGPFQTIEIVVGAWSEKQDLRCQVLDKAGHPIEAVRGANRDTTFSDADKGLWTFSVESVVTNIICDESFKANNLNPVV
jgi:hypothetical protein